MDIKQSEMQFLGFFGVFQEAFKLISSRKKIFFQIALAFLFLPSLIFMTYTTVTDGLNDSISNDQREQRYMKHWRSDDYELLARSILIKQTILKTHLIVSLFVLLVSYPLATSAVTCSVASIHAGGEITFKKLVRVVPKTYKRLANTSLYAYLFVFFAFKINSRVDEDSLYDFNRYVFGLPFYGYLTTFYCLLGHALKDLSVLGLGYMIISSQMAMVVSVLENTTGVEAINKGMKLVQGNKWTGLIRLVVFYLPIRIIYAVFRDQVIQVADSFDDYWRMNNVVNMVYAAAMVLLFLVPVVFGLVVQTVEYYVSKSENCESVDVLTLVDDLDEVSHDEPVLPEEEKSLLKGANEETKQEQVVENV